MPADKSTSGAGERELDIRVGFGLAATEAELGALLAIARQIDVPAGQVLYVRDEPAMQVFVLVTGEIELQAPDSAPWLLGEGGAAGHIDVFLGRPHARTAVAIVASRLLELDAADLRDYLEDHLDVSCRMLALLSTEITTHAIGLADPSVLLASPELPAKRPGRSFADVEIPMVDRIMMLGRMELFRGGSMQGLANLAQSASEVRYAPGDVIAAAGERPTVVSFLVEGEVELAVPSGLRVTRRGPDLVAHVEELGTKPRQTSALARSSAIVLQIEREDLLDRLEEHFDLVAKMLAYVACELDRLNRAATASEPITTHWK